MTLKILIGILIPFIGTSLGSACVFFMKREIGDSWQKTFNGFAAGVMTAASVWSLLIPAVEMSGHMGRFSFVPALLGLLAGILFFYSSRTAWSPGFAPVERRFVR